MADPVKVTMYNVGFGDCFLVRFPGQDRERRVLIDCGTIKNGAAGGVDGIVDQVIEDVTDAGEARIDVVVATHRHKDHVSGFDNDGWAAVDVDEVWLPWTEDPDDAEARRILQEMASFKLALEREVASLSTLSAAETELLQHVLANNLTLTSDEAMATLHRGFKGGPHGAKRRFLSRSTTFDADVLPNVTVHVMGPSKDEDVIRDMNPPSDESFLRVAAAGAEAAIGLLPFRVDAYAEPPAQQLVDLLHRMSGEAAIFGAVALEQAVNNTSVILAFEVGNAVLLFPGDAQYGSWKLNLKDDRTADVMRRTTFYKIGHHGSHNATPVTFVEEILEPTTNGHKTIAAASVTPHGKFKEIPKAELIDELKQRLGDQRVIRSDKPPAAGSEPNGVTVTRSGGNAVSIEFEIATD